jgi:hypothetical protein
MLTREDVARIAREEGLGEHAEDLVGCVRAGWRLDLDPDGDPGAPGVTKLGGHPDLAAGESWPHNSRGIAMTFLAQIDCGALPAVDPEWSDPPPWPRGTCLLRVFADLVDNPIEPGPARVLAVPSGGALARTVAPPLPEPWPGGGEWDELPPEMRYRTLPEAAVRVVPFLSAPESHPVLSPDGPGLRGQAGDYYTWALRLRVHGAVVESSPRDEPRPWDVHHFLGEAASIQEDVRSVGTMFYGDEFWARVIDAEVDPALADVDAWRPLLAVHDDERIGLRVHDSGAFTVLIPAADLAAGRFDRVVCSVDS